VYLRPWTRGAVDFLVKYNPATGQKLEAYIEELKTKFKNCVGGPAGRASEIHAAVDAAGSRYGQ
jgi:hypothetical protein